MATPSGTCWTTSGPTGRCDKLRPGDAEDWRRWLLQDQEGKPESPKLADNTMRRRSSLAKQFFAYAIRKGWADSNPFAGLAGRSAATPSECTS